MRNRGLRILLVVLGVLGIVVGGVFAGQGADLIPGSFMTGDKRWLEVGLLMVVVGVVLLVVALRRRRPPR